MYTLAVKRNFIAQHFLIGGDWGEENYLHSHHYVLEVLLEGRESNAAYTTSKDEIRILHKSGQVMPMSQSTDYDLQSREVTKYFLCYPKAVFPKESGNNETNP